jgi:hypothetical protein
MESCRKKGGEQRATGIVRQNMKEPQGIYEQGISLPRDKP